MHRAVQRGLTIIETMIIVAIVGIIASVAIPAFQDSMARKAVREAVDIANPVRAALGIACSQGTLSGADNESLGLSSADSYAGDATRSIAAVGKSAAEGVVTIVLNGAGGKIDDGQTIVYTGACGADGMSWTVTGDVPAKYMPKS